MQHVAYHALVAAWHAICRRECATSITQTASAKQGIVMLALHWLVLTSTKQTVTTKNVALTPREANHPKFLPIFPLRGCR